MSNSSRKALAYRVNFDTDTDSESPKQTSGRNSRKGATVAVEAKQNEHWGLDDDGSLAPELKRMKEQLRK